MVRYPGVFNEEINPEASRFMARSLSADSTLIRERKKTEGKENILLLDEKELRLRARKSYASYLLAE